MELEQLNELTKIAYEKTADKYHHSFKDEMERKEYDRLLLDRYSEMLQVNSLVCDAGCGPSGHIGSYLYEKGHMVTGIDFSQRCIEIATSHNPGIDFRAMDMMNTNFEDEYFDGIVSFYSILYTPKKHLDKIFAEFNRILKKDGKLLVVVKRGINEGIIEDEWYEGNRVYFSYFLEDEIKNYFSGNNFRIDFFDTRKPYEFEYNVDRIYAIGTKTK